MSQNAAQKPVPSTSLYGNCFGCPTVGGEVLIKDVVGPEVALQPLGVGQAAQGAGEGGVMPLREFPKGMCNDAPGHPTCPDYNIGLSLA